MQIHKDQLLMIEVRQVGKGDPTMVLNLQGNTHFKAYSFTVPKEALTMLEKFQLENPGYPGFVG